MSFLRFLMLVGLFFTSYINLKSQNLSYKLTIEKGENYSQVFSNLEKKFNLHLSYPAEVGELICVGAITYNESQLQSLLNKLFFHLKLEFLQPQPKEILIRPLIKFEAENYYWLSFQLRDANEKTPLPLILVHTPGLSHAEYTDESGWCALKVPAKQLEGRMQIHSFNYEPIEIVIDKSKKTQHIELDLQLQNNKLPALTIKSQKKHSPYIPAAFVQHGGQKYNSQNVSIYGNDPVKQVQIISGVQAHDDKNTGLKIRGGAEEATLLLVDHTPVYKLDHILGVFTVVNGDFYNEWTLHKNQIPVEYGGKTGGMFDLTSTKSESPIAGKFNLNFLYSSLTVKSKLFKNGHLGVGLRKSFSTILSSSLNDFSSRSTVLNSQPEARRNRSIVINQPSFNFYDGQWNAGWKWREKHELSFQGFVSSDELNNNYSTTFRTNIFLFNEKQNQQKSWRNTAGSLLYTFHQKKNVLEVLAYGTRFHEISDLGYFINRINPNFKRSDTLLNHNDNTIFDSGLKALIRSKKQPDFLSGSEWVRHDNVLFFTESDAPVFEINRVQHIFSAFGQYKQKIAGSWHIQGELRTSYLPTLASWWLMPQLILAYDKNNFQAKAGIAKYNQAVRTLEFENFFGQRSAFFVLANQSSIPVSNVYNTFVYGQYSKKGFSVLTELYYRKTYGNIFLTRNIASLLGRNVPVSLSDYTLFQGDGRFYGLDLGISYNRKGWSQSYQYSISKSENRFERLFNNQYFPTAEDSRHQWKILQGYQIDNWHFQSTMIFASGRPFTNVNQILADRDVVEITDINPEKYQDRLPHYFRWDALIGRRFALSPHTNLTFEFSCFNILNRLNVKYRQFYFQLPNSNAQNTILGNDVTQLGRTFNVSATLSFF